MSTVDKPSSVISSFESVEKSDKDTSNPIDIPALFLISTYQDYERELQDGILLLLRMAPPGCRGCWMNHKAVSIPHLDCFRNASIFIRTQFAWRECHLLSAKDTRFKRYLGWSAHNANINDLCMSWRMLHRR